MHCSERVIPEKEINTTPPTSRPRSQKSRQNIGSTQPPCLDKPMLMRDAHNCQRIGSLNPCPNLPLQKSAPNPAL